ncbi:MAG: cell division protein FtsB [Candidatus Competibacter sp.]
MHLTRTETCLNASKPFLNAERGLGGTTQPYLTSRCDSKLAACQISQSMQILVAVLIAALVALQYLLWIDEDGVRQSYALRISVQAQTEQNVALNERNRALEADIKDLKTGLTAIEERARSEMGMIRQDETFYRLLERPIPPPTAPKAPAQPTQ